MIQMAEKMQIVADLQIDDIDTSAIEKKLTAAAERAMSSVKAVNFTPAAFMTGGTQTEHAIRHEIEILSSSLKKATTTESVKGESSMVSTAGAAEAAEAKKQSMFLKSIIEGVAIGNLVSTSILKQFDLIFQASADLQDEMSMISKLISLMVMPFINLLIPLLLPVFTLLLPIVRLLNTALRPLFDMLMASSAEVMAQTNLLIAQNNYAGAIVMALLGISGGIVVAVTGLVAGIAQIIIWLGKVITDGLFDVIGWLIEQIFQVVALLATAIKEIMRDVVVGLASAIGNVLQALIAIIPSQLGGGTGSVAYKAAGNLGATTGTLFDKTVGAALDTITTLALNMKDNLQGSIDAAKKSIDSFSQNLADGFVSSIASTQTSISNFQDWVFNMLVPASNKAGEASVDLANTMTSAANDIIAAKAALESASSGTTVTYATAAATATQTVTTGEEPATKAAAAAAQQSQVAAKTEEEIVAAIWQPFQEQLMAAGLAYGDPAYYLQRYLASNGTELAWLPKYLNVNQAEETIQNGEYAQYIGDAIITKDGQVIKPDANDTLFATKNPGGMGGNTFNITINGNGEKAIGDMVRQAIEKYNATMSRSGYFHKGY